jgi:hypothetical protein
MEDNTVIRTNFIINETNTQGAEGIRLLRNIPDCVIAKLWYGVKNYIGQPRTISPAFQAFLTDVASHPVEWRTPKNFGELAITDHIELVNQFIHENLVHHMASTDGITVVTYEELCHDAGGWVKKFADSRQLTLLNSPYQVAINISPANQAEGPVDLTISNWSASNLSAETFRRINNRIIAIRERMSLQAQ